MAHDEGFHIYEVKFMSDLYSNNKSVGNLISEKCWLPPSDYYILCNGRAINRDEPCQVGQLYQIVPRLVGGKGGFGSMLRAIGTQIEKTTNKEACRDLSGRRMRDLNNEKQLRDWVGQKAAREKEKQREQEERLEQKRRTPRHVFDDPTYERQRREVTENLDDAIQQGLRKLSKKGNKASSSAASSSAASTSAASSSSVASSSIASTSIASNSSKRKAAECKAVTSKRSRKLIHTDVGVDDKERNSGASDRIESKLSTDPCAQELVQPGVDKDSSDGTRDALISGVDSNPEIHESKEESRVPDKSAPIEEMSNSIETHEDFIIHEKVTICGDGEKGEAQEIKNDSIMDTQPLNLEEFNSMEELETLGFERLKLALTALGLKCGGTLRQRAERLWSVRGLDRDDINPSLLAKPGKAKNKK